MTTYELWLLVLTVAMFIAAALAVVTKDVRWVGAAMAGFAAYLFTVVLHSA